MITHLKLTGSSASLVSDTFGSASSNVLAATLAAVLSFLIWGLGIGQIFQNVYARAWRITVVGSAVDQGLFAIWFVALTGAVGAAAVAAEQLKTAGWLVLVPVWLVASTAFWLWTPRFLLHRKVGLRPLLPGALLASVFIGGAVATSPLWVAPWVNSYGKYFGSFGVVVALVAYVFILATLSMVCAVFSPVWADWRRTERERRSSDQRRVPPLDQTAPRSPDAPA
jgi:membrane protein